MKALIEKLRNPAWLIGAIVAVALIAIFFVQGTVGWLAAGAAAQVISFIAALVCGIAGAKLVRFLSILVPDKYTEGLANDPQALSRVILAVYLFVGLCVLAAFGG